MWEGGQSRGVREVPVVSGRMPGALHFADFGRDDTKKDEESDALALCVAGSASAWGRKPGSLHSADSGRDDTKKQLAQGLSLDSIFSAHASGSRDSSLRSRMTQRTDVAEYITSYAHLCRGERRKSARLPSPVARGRATTSPGGRCHWHLAGFGCVAHQAIAPHSGPSP